MQAACDVAFEYVHVRKQFNTRIGEFQLMQVCFYIIAFMLFGVFDTFIFFKCMEAFPIPFHAF